MPSEDSYERRRRRTLSDDDRGQTLQDFAAGVSLFIITVSFVLGLFPSFLSPFTTGSGESERAQAERIARTLVLNLSTADGKGTLDARRLEHVLNSSESQLRDRYGLGRTAGINITVRSLDGRTIEQYNGSALATPSKRKNQSAEAVARIITLNNETTCRPGCRLVVKVW